MKNLALLIFATSCANIQSSKVHHKHLNNPFKDWGLKRIYLHMEQNKAMYDAFKHDDWSKLTQAMKSVDFTKSIYVQVKLGKYKKLPLYIAACRCNKVHIVRHIYAYYPKLKSKMKKRKNWIINDRIAEIINAD